MALIGRWTGVRTAKSPAHRGRRASALLMTARLPSGVARWYSDSTMADKRSTHSLQAPGGSERAYGSPQAEPLPAIREPAKSPASIRLPGRSERLAPDDQLARPEFGEEVVDGVRMECSPATEEHADPQCRLAAVVSICTAKGYVASTELLTRTDAESDFATDVCVRKDGVDPETGGRYLEELSFEVANIRVGDSGRVGEGRIAGAPKPTYPPRVITLSRECSRCRNRV